MWVRFTRQFVEPVVVLHKVIERFLKFTDLQSFLFQCLTEFTEAISILPCVFIYSVAY